MDDIISCPLGEVYVSTMIEVPAFKSPAMMTFGLLVKKFRRSRRPERKISGEKEEKGALTLWFFLCHLTWHL